MTQISIFAGMLSNIEAEEIPAVWSSDLVHIVALLLGDANNDGTVNVLDITKVVRYILYEDEVSPAADANQDGEIDVADLTAIARIILGLPPVP